VIDSNRDPAKLNKVGLGASYIELAREVNTNIPRRVVYKPAGALNEPSKAVKGSHILVPGIVHKPNAGGMRESPALELMQRLSQGGARIDYPNTQIPVFPPMRNYRFDLRSLALSAETIARDDLVLIATNHDAFDCGLVRRQAKFILDTRGVYQGPFPTLVEA